MLFRQGDHDGAKHEIEIAMNRSQARDRDTMFGSRNESTFANIMIADIERQLGNLPRARQLIDDGLSVLDGFERSHPAQGHLLAIALVVAAKIDLAESELDRAANRLVDAYEVGLGTRDMPIVASVGVGIALLAAARERFVDAAEILGATAQLRGGDDRTAFDIRNLQSELTDRLEPGASVAAYARGRGLTRADALTRLDPAAFAG